MLVAPTSHAGISENAFSLYLDSLGGEHVGVANGTWTVIMRVVHTAAFRLLDFNDDKHVSRAEFEAGEVR